jgi:RNA polymerase subunit RPABC4/transcription elongation factor Spt4
VVDENYAGTQPAAIAPLNMLHRPAGKNLARPDSTPRARRFCRRCNTRLNGRTTQCANCHHLNSPPTPREPPDVSTHPEGSADDGEETVPIARREFKPIRMHVRWTCHACHTVFKDLERECRGCGHRRCDDCPREPPKEEEEPLDEAAVRKIADLMRNVNISPHASAA